MSEEKVGLDARLAKFASKEVTRRSFIFEPLRRVLAGAVASASKLDKWLPAQSAAQEILVDPNSIESQLAATIMKLVVPVFRQVSAQNVRTHTDTFEIRALHDETFASHHIDSPIGDLLEELLPEIQAIVYQNPIIGEMIAPRERDLGDGHTEEVEKRQTWFIERGTYDENSGTVTLNTFSFIMNCDRVRNTGGLNHPGERLTQRRGTSEFAVTYITADKDSPPQVHFTQFYTPLDGPYADQKIEIRFAFNAQTGNLTERPLGLVNDKTQMYSSPFNYRAMALAIGQHIGTPVPDRQII